MIILVADDHHTELQQLRKHTLKKAWAASGDSAASRPWQVDGQEVRLVITRRVVLGRQRYRTNWYVNGRHVGWNAMLLYFRTGKWPDRFKKLGT